MILSLNHLRRLGTVMRNKQYLSIYLLYGPTSVDRITSSIEWELILVKMFLMKQVGNLFPAGAKEVMLDKMKQITLPPT